MKTWLLTLLLAVPGWRWLTHVRHHNEAQALGRQAWQRGRPAEAAYYLGQAVALAGHSGPGPALLLSLGQAQVAAGQLVPARATLQKLLVPTVPASLGSAARQQLAGLLARQGETAQAINLLRQALRLNPANAAARYNYEVLRQYLTQEAEGEPATPPSGAGPPPPGGSKQPSPGEGQQGKRPRPASSGASPPPTGTPNTPQSQPGGTGPAPTPSPTGLPNQPQPTPNAGTSAAGGPAAGTGPERPLPSGSAPGRQRGLDPAGGAGSGRGGRPGTEAATEADTRLQTQRERLRAMNLSPAQARQLLEELRAGEQQYLQQRPRLRQGPPPAPGTPTW